MPSHKHGPALYWPFFPLAVCVLRSIQTIAISKQNMYAITISWCWAILIFGNRYDISRDTHEIILTAFGT